MAAYLRVLADARRAGLPTELAAEEAWPHFRAAVVAALREGRELRGVASERWLDDLGVVSSREAVAASAPGG